MDYRELIERLRGFEIDHSPDGWPAIRMREISAMCDAIESLLAENERLKHNLTSTEQTMREYQELAAKRLEEIAKYRDAEMGGDSDSEKAGYWCVVCGRFLRADEFGVIVHDDKPHPESMTFELIEVKAAENASWNAGFNVQVDQLKKLTAERDAALNEARDFESDVDTVTQHNVELQLETIALKSALKVARDALIEYSNGASGAIAKIDEVLKP